MRSLSDFEKLIIKNLTDESQFSYTFPYFLSRVLSKNEAFQITKEKKIKFIIKPTNEYYNSTNTNKIVLKISYIKSLRYKLVSLYSFLIYLEKNNYLIFDKPLTNRSEIINNFYGNINNQKHYKENKSEYINANLSENLTITKKIIVLLNRDIIPLESLIDFHNTKYKTYDQKQTEKQIHISWIGICTAIFIGLVSIVISIINPLSPKEFYKTVPQELRINNEYNMLFLEEIRNSSVKLDSLKYVFENKDSLNNK